MTDNETIRLIDTAADCLRSGLVPDEVSNLKIARMMRRIMANVIMIQMCGISHRIVTMIDEGCFRCSQDDIDDLEKDFAKCLSVMGNWGNDTDDCFSKDEIRNAIAYTLYEEEHKDDMGE